MSYKCEIVADSINSNNNRLTTFLITYPRIIHSELMTHRVFSRNSASSRAIPFEKMVKMVEDDPFIPIAWQEEHKGMQGSEYWIDDDTVTVDEGDEYERYTKTYSATEHFITEWLEARDLAIAQSYELNRLGVTKQLCNRLLEPFMWHTVLVTATSYENFFELRCPKYHSPVDIHFLHKSKKDCIAAHSNPVNLKIFNEFSIEDWLAIDESQAEIHIQALAEAMYDAYNKSTPKELKEGEWHIPFGDKIKMSILDQRDLSLKFPYITSKQDLKCRIAVARCARLSYMTFDREIDYEKDVKLYEQLLKSKHFSPFEHVAKCPKSSTLDTYISETDEGITHCDKDLNLWSGNFKGWIQYRQLVQ